MNTQTQSGVGIYRRVVAMVALAVIASLVGAVVLALAGQSTSKVVAALVLATVGSLAGLFAPSPWRKPVE